MTVQKLLRLPDDLAQQVREFRFDARLATEQEAYIELIRYGLASFEPKTARKPKPPTRPSEPRAA
jgi:hypothetical protein